MRIVLISDTHGLHRQLEVPGGDLLIHAGDFTFQSTPPSAVSDFNAWLGTLPHRHKVVIPGNHEFVLEEPRNRGAITNAILLVDSGVEVEGIRIWGSPVTPLYGAFGKSRPEDRKRLWAQIPDGLDILVTHGPPFAILDHSSRSERREGCPQLLEAVFQAFPPLHVFGHIHHGYGTLRFYVSHHNDPIDERMAAAVVESSRICKICRQPGSLRKLPWLKTLCKEHANAHRENWSRSFCRFPAVVQKVGFTAEAKCHILSSGFGIAGRSNS